MWLFQGCHIEVCGVLLCLSYIPVKCLSWLRTDYLIRQMSPHYWQLFASQQTDQLLLPPLTGDLARIQEWCNHWCMRRNTIKTKALVVGRSRTVNPKQGYLWFLYELVQTSMHILGFFPCLSENWIFWGWWNADLWTPLCYFVAIFHRFSQSLSIVRQWRGQLLNVTFSFFSARCIQWPGLALIRLSCRCVIDVVLLGLVCWTRLMPTLITVCSAIDTSASSRVRHTGAAAAAHSLEFEVSRCRTSKFARCFLPTQVRMWNYLQTLC